MLPWSFVTHCIWSNKIGKMKVLFFKLKSTKVKAGLIGCKHFYLRSCANRIKFDYLIFSVIWHDGICIWLHVCLTVFFFFNLLYHYLSNNITVSCDMFIKNELWLILLIWNCFLGWHSLSENCIQWNYSIARKRNNSVSIK